MMMTVKLPTGLLLIQRYSHFDKVGSWFLRYCVYPDAMLQVNMYNTISKQIYKALPGAVVHHLIKILLTVVDS